MASNALTLTTTVGFSPMDLFTSAMSLAANFWPFLILGLAFTIAPWVFGILRSAVSRRGKKAA
jgi:hypothetical protein